MENITPEARNHGRELLAEGYQTYVIDDAELERLYQSYPVLWPDKDARPTRVFIGCPHNTLAQLTWWSGRILQGLEESGQDEVACTPYIFVSDAVKSQFQLENPELAARVEAAGIHITRNCPVVYMTTPNYDDELIVTNSNKTRAYSKSRFYLDDDLVEIVLTGELPDARPATAA